MLKLATISLLLLMQSTHAEPWVTVGNAQLQVLWFKIYHISLANRSGEYMPGDYPQLLTIDYQRAIDKQALLDATAQEWQRLEPCQPRVCQQWLQQLADIWQGISKGEQLSFLASSADSGLFYYNGQAIGRVEQPGFADAFLAIWLSPDSRYPKQRQALINQP